MVLTSITKPLNGHVKALSEAYLDETVYHGDVKIIEKKNMFSKLLGRCDTRCAVASPVMQDSMDSGV